MSKSSIILLLFSQLQAGYGFKPSTKVHVYKDFYKRIDDIMPSSLLTGYASKEVSGFVLGKDKNLSELVVRIFFKKTHISCGPLQKIYCQNRQQWLSAQEFNVYDHLLSTDGTFIKIKRVTISAEQRELYVLHCTWPHTYAVGPHKVLVHNQEYVSEEFINSLVNVLNKTQTVNITGLQGACIMIMTKLLEHAGAQSLFLQLPFVGWIAAAIASSYYLYYWTTYHILPAVRVWWCPKRNRFIIQNSKSANCADRCCLQANETDNLIVHKHNY